MTGGPVGLGAWVVVKGVGRVLRGRRQPPAQDYKNPTRDLRKVLNREAAPWQETCGDKFGGME